MLFILNEEQKKFPVAIKIIQGSTKTVKLGRF